MFKQLLRIINRFNPFKEQDNMNDEIETFEIVMTPQPQPRIWENVYTKVQSTNEDKSFHFINNQERSSSEAVAELQGVIDELVTA